MKPKLLITVEGGVIQGVHADTDEVEVIVIDHDDTGGEWNVPRITIPDTDDTTFEAHVFKMPVTINQKWVDAITATLEQSEQE